MGRLFQALLTGVVIVYALTTIGTTPAKAAPYAAVVMDMRNGKIMHSRGADRRQHPASLTKMMTLYLAFDAVESGQIDLDKRVRVSRRASKATGSRLWLKAGERVRVRDLIRATAIRSANDAAIALAEAIAGSEKAFASQMTKKARELGMSSTTYKNAHGLTRTGHLSTARDQALLARHLFYDFPDYYNVFGRRRDRAAGRRIYSTNRLLGVYRGMEGMKTGYTRAAGYNLVGTAKRGNERIIVVVLGGKSARTRNRRVAELLDLGFKRAKTHVAVIRPGGNRGTVAKSPAPWPRPGTPTTGIGTLTAALNASAHAATAPQSSTSSTPSTAPRAPRLSRYPLPRKSRETKAVSTPAPILVNVPTPHERPNWSIDLGSYRDRAGAVARRARVVRASSLRLAKAQATIQRSTYRGRPSFQVIFGGLTAQKAQAVCAKIARHCNPIPPERGG